jgi:hypothetical protein
LAGEDFAQILGQSRNTKYDALIEKLRKGSTNRIEYGPSQRRSTCEKWWAVPTLHFYVTHTQPTPVSHLIEVDNQLSFIIDRKKGVDIRGVKW